MNILVLRTDKLGDFITALPAIYVLKKHNPKDKIIVCVAALNEALAKSCTFVDAVIVDDASSSLFTLAKKIKNENIDASVTLFSNTKVAVAQFLAGIATRIAPATKIAQIFYTHRVKQHRSEVKMSEFEYNLALTQELFADIDLSYPQPLLAFKDRAQIYDVFCINNDIQREVIAFHLGFGGSSDANLTLEEYENLIRNLLLMKKYQVIMTFGPDEKELYEQMQDRFAGLDIVFYLSLDGVLYFAKLLSSFKLFVSTSTGTYHLASAVGTPTMTFFADTLFASSARWKAIGEAKKQKHFMLPLQEEQREKIFKEIKLELLSL